MSTAIQVTVGSGNSIAVTLSSVMSGHIQVTDWGWFVSPVESPDGSRTVFTLPNSEKYRSGYIKVFRDGIMLDSVVTELTGRQTFQLDTAPDADESIKLLYLKDTT